MKNLKILILIAAFAVLIFNSNHALADVVPIKTKVFKFVYNKNNIYEPQLPSKICEPAYYLTRKYLGKELTSKRKGKFSELSGINQVKAWRAEKYSEADMKAKDGYIYLIIERKDLVRTVCFEEQPDYHGSSKSKNKKKSKKDKKSNSKNKSKKDKKSKNNKKKKK